MFVQLICVLKFSIHLLPMTDLSSIFAATVRIFSQALMI
ncbi:unnamed protein product, partial [Rotaria sp. Silwood1]